MNSFLEKLQKGMGPQPNVSNDDGLETETSSQEPPSDNAAVFAGYKTGVKRTKRGIPTLDETDVPKPLSRPQERTIITAENINEVPETEEPPSKTNKKNKEKKNPKKTRKTNMANKKNPVQSWLNREEAQLAVNVYQTEMDLVLQAALAGVKVEDLDVLIEDEVINIKGERLNPLAEDGDYFVEECYFGPFSRKIILPVEVDSGRADAAMKDGILTIRIPKIQHEKKKKITIKA